jgi:hypothetical protein
MIQSLAGVDARIGAHDSLLKGLWRALYYHGRVADAVLLREWLREIEQHQYMLAQLSQLWPNKLDCPIHWTADAPNVNVATIFATFMSRQERAELDGEQISEIERLRTA